MRTAGIPPSLASANLVIAAYSTSGKVVEAMAVLDELLELGLYPNSFTVAALLQVGGKTTQVKVPDSRFRKVHASLRKLDLSAPWRCCCSASTNVCAAQLTTREHPD